MGEFQVSHKGRFALSLVLGILTVALLAGGLAKFVYPELVKPNLVVQVVSAPPLPESTPPDLPNELPPRLQPPPTPPVRTPAVPPPHRPVAPLLATPSPMDTDFLVADNETSLDIISQFQEREEQRLAEILEKEERERKAAEEAKLLAQEKAAEEKAQRAKEAATRALAARAREERRAQEQAIASKEAEARRAQEQALASNREQARRAAAQAEAQKRAAAQAAAQAAAEARRVASRASLQKTSQPKYPTSARRSGLQGTTRIQATVTTSGKISSPRIIASSGHSSLDSSALKAVKKYRFAPARNGLGKPIADQVVIPITFRLN